MRIPELFLTDAQLAQRYNVNRSTIWRWIKSAPNFPQPVKLSPNCTRFRQSEIDVWEAGRSSAA